MLSYITNRSGVDLGKHVTHQMWPTEVDRVEPLTEPDELIHLLVGIVDSLLENVYTVVRTVLSQT